MDADITVFDPTTVIDRATFQNPKQPSAGIEDVIVNGVVVQRDGHLLIRSSGPGRPIRGEH
jgi:N-acyl-D-aspartate/D-glutamate deacylase